MASREESAGGDWRCDPAFKTRLLLGDEGLARLNGATVMVIGVGGVGGSCVEALARCGVGRLVLVDPDVVSPTNLNRQAVARVSTLGMPKVEAARLLVADVAPGARVDARAERIGEADVEALLDTACDFVVDAQDTVSTKLALAAACERRGVALVSSMGTGNKLHPELFEFADIYETSVCPLCKVVRREAKARGIAHLQVLYSREQPRRVAGVPGAERRERTCVGTVGFVPPAAGLMIAGYVVRALTGLE